MATVQGPSRSPLPPVPSVSILWCDGSGRARYHPRDLPPGSPPASAETHNKFEEKGKLQEVCSRPPTTKSVQLGVHRQSKEDPRMYYFFHFIQ